MMMSFRRTFLRVIRVMSLVLLAAFGTILLMRFAPGYFTDAREMDSRYAGAAKTALAQQQLEGRGPVQLAAELLGGWMHGDIGLSRQYDVPVAELIRPRIALTAKLMLGGIAYGWLIACTLALALSARRTTRGEALIAGPAALLLSVPIGAMATVCVVANKGGALTVLATIIAVRDFKLVYRLLREARKSPALLFAQAQGPSSIRFAWAHLLRPLSGRLFALALLSFVTALSAIVPLEVIFDLPGLGQLAWSAAMNRDLPVLLDVTILMAAAVGTAGMLSESPQRERMA